MEVKVVVSLLFLGLISTALAKPKGGHGHHDDDHHRHGKYHHDVRKCPQPVTHPNLPMKCTVADDCNTFSCSAEIGDETVTLTLKIDTSQEPMSAKVSLKVPSRNYDWSHTLKSGEKIQVPGFPLAIRGLMDADMFLMFTMSKEEGGVAFELDLSLTAGNVGESFALLKGKLPSIDEKPYEHHRWGRCHRFASWFKRQSAPVKASIIISAIIVFVLLICGLVYCCKRRRTGKQLKVLPPSYDEATTTKTKVPMEPLVNEE